MSIPARLKEEDQLTILKALRTTFDEKAQPVLPDRYDYRIVDCNDDGVPLSQDSIARQLEDVAYRHRESMVAFALILTDAIAGKPVEKFNAISAHIFDYALSFVAGQRLRFPTHDGSVIGTEAMPKVTRKDGFYDAAFWSSEIVKSWVVVHIVWEWYAYHLRDWAEQEARNQTWL